MVSYRRQSPSYHFTSSTTRTTEGAVLLLPEGASRKDLWNYQRHFQQYAMQNALCWYQFANVYLGREIPNGSLILVTGCDMASSWGIASFPSLSSDMEIELHLRPSYRGTYAWKTNVGSATVRTSPGHQLISDLNRANSGAPSTSDQPTAEGRDLSSSWAVDARGGIITQVTGNQIIVFPPAPIDDRCKL